MGLRRPRVGLGHARLSIIDLATGDQPIASEDEALRIVVNGEFYDFERIQRDLEGRGHRLRTRSDSEIALHLYEDLGTACLQPPARRVRLRALGRPQRHALRRPRPLRHQAPLLRDPRRHAVPGLRDQGAARGRRARPLGPRRVLPGQPLPRCAPQDRTLFDGIYQVPPGHYLLATGGQVRLIRYWDFDYPAADETGRSAPTPSTPSGSGTPSTRRSASACGPTCRSAATSAAGSTPAPCWAWRRRTAVEPIRAFTLTFDRADYDEGAIAREMAAHAGADFHPIPIRQSDLADHFADATWQAETLFFNAHGVAKYLLSRAVRDAGYKVVLTGEGSDEILAGYPHFRRDMLLYNAQGQDADAVRQLLEQLQASNPVSRGLLLPEGEALPLASLRRALGFVPSWLEAHATAASRLRALFATDFAAEFAGRDPYRVFLNGLDVAGQLAGREPVNQSLYLWSKTMLPNYILAVLGDRMEMAHSVEGRVPFLDHHVVELVRDLPVSQKIRGMTEKYVLREAARPVLTATVYGRQKHPFLAPPAALSPGERLYELVQETLRGPALASLPFYDRAKVVALLDGLPALGDDARTALDPVLMILLSACCLHQRYFQ